MQPKNTSSPQSLPLTLFLCFAASLVGSALACALLSLAVGPLDRPHFLITLLSGTCVGTLMASIAAICRR